MENWVKDVHDFWFEHLGPKRWFRGGEQIDEEVTDRFEPLWSSLRHEKAIFFLTDPATALSGIILFDQFPRNMFRDSADAFSTDILALRIAEGAVDAGFDAQLSVDERTFIYMPFMHSERMRDQDRSVELFTMLGRSENLDFALKHRAVIARFGRFPHRNEVLGRETRPEEADALALGKGW